MNLPMAIRVTITANTAAKNVDIMFSLMSWFLCRYLLSGGRPLRPVRKNCKNISLSSLLPFQSQSVMSFAFYAKIHLSQQSTHIRVLSSLILLLSSADPKTQITGNAGYEP
jgi:hypothetical protein